MIKMHNHSKYILIILIFFISIIIGFKFSKISNALNQTSNLQLEDNINKTFNSLQYYRKLAVEYNVSNISNIISDIKKISTNEYVKVLNSNREGNYYVILIEVENTNFDLFYEALHSIPGFNSENILNDNSNNYNMDIKEHIKIKELAKDQLQGLLIHSSIPERLTKYNNQLEQIQQEIDGLYAQLNLREKYNNFTLVSIVTKQNIDSKNKLISSLTQFLLYTFIALILLIIFASILYFIMIILLKFMKLIGIRTSSSTSSYYSPKKKSIKRKFKQSAKIDE